MQAKEWSDEERDARSERSKRLGLRPTGRWAKTGWTPEQDALLGTMPDVDVGAAVGRTAAAVRARRQVLEVPTFADRRRSTSPRSPVPPPVEVAAPPA